jgi:hypothetical protein
MSRFPRLRFSLRTLLIFVLLAGSGLWHWLQWRTILLACGNTFRDTARATDGRRTV